MSSILYAPQSQGHNSPKPLTAAFRSLTLRQKTPVPLPGSGAFLLPVRKLLSKLPSFLSCSLSSQALLGSSRSMWLETGMIKKGASDYNKTKKAEFVLFSLKEDPVVGYSLESCNLDNLSVCSGQRKACDNGFRDHDHSLGQWGDTHLTDPHSLFCFSPEPINKQVSKTQFKVCYQFFFFILDAGKALCQSPVQGCSWWFTQP